MKAAPLRAVRFGNLFAGLAFPPCLLSLGEDYFLKETVRKSLFRKVKFKLKSLWQRLRAGGDQRATSSAANTWRSSLAISPQFSHLNASFSKFGIVPYEPGIYHPSAKVSAPFAGSAKPSQLLQPSNTPVSHPPGTTAPGDAQRQTGRSRRGRHDHALWGGIARGDPFSPRPPMKGVRGRSSSARPDGWPRGTGALGTPQPCPDPTAPSRPLHYYHYYS